MEYLRCCLPLFKVMRPDIESVWLGQFAAESPARLQLSLVEVTQMDPRAWPDMRDPGFGRRWRTQAATFSWSSE